MMPLPCGSSPIWPGARSRGIRYRLMLTRASLLLAVAVATGLAACKGAPHQAGSKDLRGDLRVRVEADLAQRGGRRYYLSVSDHLMANYPETIRSCLASSHEERPAGFELFMTVDADGSLSEISSVPATVVGVCMSQRLLHDRLPPPP